MSVLTILFLIMLVAAIVAAIAGGVAAVGCLIYNNILTMIGVSVMVLAGFVMFASGVGQIVIRAPIW